VACQTKGLGLSFQTSKELFKWQERRVDGARQRRTIPELITL
jgi:hypothetical protein